MTSFKLEANQTFISAVPNPLTGGVCFWYQNKNLSLAMKILDIYCSNAWMKPNQMDSVSPVTFAGVAQYCLWELFQLFFPLYKP